MAEPTAGSAVPSVISPGPLFTPCQKPLNQLFCSLPTTIFEVMSKLAVEHKAVNLGQGEPAAARLAALQTPDLP